MADASQIWVKDDGTVDMTTFSVSIFERSLHCHSTVSQHFVSEVKL